jgi:methyl-accepting chemotaxis protein
MHSFSKKGILAMTTPLLRRISIQHRLFLLIGLVSVALFIPLILALLDYQQSLMTNKQNKTQHLVQTAYTLVEHYHQQHIKGEIGLEQAKTGAANAVQSLRYDANDYFWINDLTPTMVMHPMKPALNGQDLSQIADPNGKKLFVDMVTLAKQQQSGLVHYMWPKPGSESPVEKVSYIKLFKPWGWVIGSGVYVDDVNALTWQAIQKVLMSVIAALAVMLAIAYIIGRSIIKPCRDTLAALDDIASGDGDLSQTLPETGSDELSHIAKAFNQFTHKLESIIRDIKPVTEDITQAAIALNTVAQQGAAQSEQQQQAVDTVASAMNELHASNREVANSAQQAAEAAQEASSQGQHGGEVIERATSHMQALSMQLTETDQNIQMLATETQEVGSVLEVIRGVAEQTNLLALNAAIEAARAGEQGRGFAVVADEVRTLATRTQSSTDEIEQIIQKLQTQAAEVSQSMTLTQQQSTATIEHTEQARQALQQIDQRISAIASLNELIAAASSQQTLATDEISQNLTQIADHGSQSANEAKKLAEASEQLMENGNTLSVGVGVFKVQS